VAAGCASVEFQECAMTKLRWGLMGASDIAATRMIAAFRTAGDDVVGVLSGEADRARGYATAHGLDVATADPAELLDRSDITAVYVSSTNDKHYAQAMAAIDAGKHVLCEKPLALTYADAMAMVDAAERAGVVFAVNHHLPGAGTHRTVQRLVRDGAIGTPLAVRVAHGVSLPERLRGWRLDAVPGGGVILDVTCHDASAINAILPMPPLFVSAVATSQGSWGSGAYDAAMTVIRYGDGVLAQTHDAFTIGFAKTALEVHGTSGSITATGVMTQDPVGEVRLVDANGPRDIAVDDRRDLYQIILEGFHAAVTGDGRPTVTGVEGARALAVALAAQESADSRRSVDVQLAPTAA
jgi:1,5-anhydro-D-fructose reductase (1,5-anhydro-D-mannitol-forming)